MVSSVFTFAEYQLDPSSRQLYRAGRPVALSAKAFDLLVVMVENRGRVVTKEELMKLVWQDQFVEEANLTVQMSALRKALAEKKDAPVFIVTVPGRGYSFVADVRTGGANREMVVESQSTSQFVVEEEIVVDPDAEMVNGQAWTTAPMLKGNAADLAALELSDQSRQPHAALQASPSAIGHKNKTSGHSRRRAAVLIPSAVLLLVAAFGTIWFFQSRSRNGEAMTLRRFPTHGGTPARVAISPDGKTVVYTQSFNASRRSLWLGQIESNNSMLLDQQDLGFEDLVFTPDGSSIYSNVSRANRPQPMLVRMHVLGGVMTELIPNVDSPVTFRPDGKQMAFLRQDRETRQTSIIIADAADGQNQRTLVSRKRPENFSSDGLSWSPDGKSIAFSSYNESGQEEILSVSVADGSISRISRRDWGNVERVVWLPDGSGVLVLAGENVGERLRQIWLISYPDGEARQITNDSYLFLRENTLSVSADGKLAVLQAEVDSEIGIAPHGDAALARRIFRGVAPGFEGVDGLSWTPDGRLLYTAYVGNSRVIWSMNSDGADLRQLTPNKANASDNLMCVAPDGRYVVFQSNRSGSIEIWRVSSDGSNLKQITTGGNNSQPSVSPDGLWIVYTATRDGKATLWRISIDGGEPTQITDMTSSSSQVSPDGQYIACLASSPERLVIISFAGGEPLKSFEVPSTVLQFKRRLSWTPDGKAILYPNANQGLWRQALDEEKPQPEKGFDELSLHRLAWSFDGKNLAYTSGPLTQQIILIENFK